MKKANSTDGIIFCEISFWEIAMLLKSGRVKVECSYPELLDLILASNSYFPKGITPRIADIAVNRLQDLHKDPADRLIAATAVAYQVPLVTADKGLRMSHSVKTIW
jgi:PIN domain nuclease of toxin-antitoxin system